MSKAIERAKAEQAIESGQGEFTYQGVVVAIVDNTDGWTYKTDGLAASANLDDVLSWIDGGRA